MTYPPRGRKRTRYPDVTLLITHYNRSSSLERLLASFHALGIDFGAIIVSDDASNGKHLQKLEALKQVYAFRLLTTNQNTGLGANLNRAQAAVTTDYALYVQEDFEVNDAFGDALEQSVRLMDRDAGLDLVRFFAHFRLPYLRPYKGDFEEMVIPVMAADYHKIYAYSDTPHLRRRNFAQKFGAYREDLRPDRTEYRMCLSFIVNDGRCAINRHFDTLFTHNNLPGEPSTIRRPYYQHNRNPAVQLVRYLFRQAKYNWDLLTTARTPPVARSTSAQRGLHRGVLSLK